MGPALLGVRVVLAVVFAIAGVAKLADPDGSRRAVAGFGVPDELAAPLGSLLPLLELTVAAALIPSDSARYGALGAAGLLACFVTGMTIALARGAAPDCHCFGQLRSEAVGWRSLARNLALLGAAAFVAIAGWEHPGVSATRWIAHTGGAWLVAIAAALVIAALVGFQVWFSLRLLSQNRRVLARLEGLEAAIARSSGESAQRGAGPAGSGSAVGSTAPGFVLPALDGMEYSLAALLSAERPLMLVFTDARCSPCEALMPYVARWQREHALRLSIAVVGSGDRERHAARAAEHGLERVLLQSEREVAEAYGANGTPMAVLIDADGLIASPTVAGAEAIARLLARATAPASPVSPVSPVSPASRAAAAGSVPAANGHRRAAGPAPSPRVP